MISRFFAICLVCMAVVACEFDPQDAIYLQEAELAPNFELEAYTPLCEDIREEIFYKATNCQENGGGQQYCTCHFMVFVTERYLSIASPQQVQTPGGGFLCVEGERERVLPDVTKDCILYDYDFEDPLGQHGHTCMPNPVP